MKRGAPMKRTELRRRSSLRSFTPTSGSGLRRVSPKRAREGRQYTKLRTEYLTAFPRCGWPGGCTHAATEVHHKRGRVGALYLDTAHWLPICGPHHRWATENPTDAYALGVSERRIGAA